MRIKFWGTRGSFAKPGPTTIRYGGNTSCVEVRSDSGTLIVVDCGTGGNMLGHQLMEETSGAVDGHMLISHTHWDHIQGIPFFSPFFDAESVWDIYGPKGLSHSLRATLAGQMEHTYFPIALSQFTATLRYHDLVEGTFAIDEVNILTRYLNHPALTLGYRFEVDGASLAYCCDHEPHSSALASGELPITGVDRRYADFIAGADIVIHDAQYTAKEYAESKVGWGHSSPEYAVRICRDAGVKRLILTHHEPMRDDDAIDRIVAEIRQRLREEGSPLEVEAAAEGRTIELRGTEKKDAEKAKNHFLAQTAVSVSSVTRPVLLYLADSSMAAVLAEAVAIEGIPSRNIANETELLQAVIEDLPSLVMIEHNPPGIDGLEIARAMRRTEGTEKIQVPVVLVSTRVNPGTRESGIATDWMVAPFSLSYARTKVRAWALRTAIRWIRAEAPAEEGRIKTGLSDLASANIPPDEKFDRLTRIAGAALGVPYSMISVVGPEGLCAKSGYGFATDDGNTAFCDRIVDQKEELILPDTLQDARFAQIPLLIGGARIRFYAGIPLLDDDGVCVGTFCIADIRPRELAQTDLVTLRDLADLALQEIKRSRG